ncbi:hypothetical protein Hanom_Chr12g01079301 [Helianthus anomalus]
MCLTVAIKLTVGSTGGPDEIDALQNDTWRAIASSILINLLLRTISSLTASPHNPHIHCPRYLSRIRSMYSSVHSSVNPQQSHFTDSTSVASVVRFAAGIIMASLITDVDISATVINTFSR